ncbi:MAG: hypothetical protein IJX77_03710 [Ruminococcus sp.]|nr:hypothetical protein [Ruminococcus sp.]
MGLFKFESDTMFFADIRELLFDRVISLGGTCQVAHQLNRLGLRFESYPFDWLFSTDPEQLIKALRNDLDGWLLPENLIESDKTETSHRRVTDTKYNMIHQHIFPLGKPLSESYNEVMQTVNRRVERFLSLKEGNKRLLFIRTNLNREQSDKLGALIREKFGKNAMLLVVNHIKEFRIRKVRSGLSNTYIYEIYDENENTGQKWQGYDPHWDKLLGGVRLKEEFADIADDGLFENFYPCEINEKKQKFRWTYKESVLHLERYGGCECILTFSTPAAMTLEIENVYGQKIAGIKVAPSESYKFEIKHETRYITLKLAETWSPAERFGSEDNRQLGVCLESVQIHR